MPVQGTENAAAAPAAARRAAGQHGAVRIRRFRRLVRDGQLDRHRGGRRHRRADQLFPWRRHPATGGHPRPHASTAVPPLRGSTPPRPSCAADDTRERTARDRYRY